MSRNMRALSWLLALAACKTGHSFTPPAGLVMSGTSARGKDVQVQVTAATAAGGGGACSRGDFLARTGAALLGVGLATAGLGARPADAEVYFEIERYGDKELKIATVNRLKQQLRNKVLEDPEVAEKLLRLAISDALGWDLKTGAGGLDSSVVMEMDREENKGLKPALDAVVSVAKNIKRTTEISLADVIAAGGAEAIEAVGGPRISVQLGRYDELKKPNPASGVEGYSFESPTADGMQAVFRRSGLGGREMALLLGALGSVRQVVEDAAETARGGGDDDDLTDNSWQDSVPSTFGAEKDKYGKAIRSPPGGATFGPGYLAQVLQQEKSGGLTPLGKVILGDPEARSFATKYATNEKAFMQDVAEAYQKMCLLGGKYENRLLTD